MFAAALLDRSWSVESVALELHCPHTGSMRAAFRELVRASPTETRDRGGFGYVFQEYAARIPDGLNHAGEVRLSSSAGTRITRCAMNSARSQL